MTELKTVETVGGMCQAHVSSYIDDGAIVGDGTKIWHFSHIMKGAAIGKNCSIGQNVSIGSKAIVGNNVKIQNNVSIYDDVHIDDDVFCGPSCVFTNVINPRSFIIRKSEYKTTKILKGATIGANSTIVCGVTVGRYSFVGAGAVVTKNIPDFALVYGNPAKQNGWMCSCGIKLDAELICKTCGKSYKKTGGIIEEK